VFYPIGGGDAGEVIPAWALCQDGEGDGVAYCGQSRERAPYRYAAPEEFKRASFDEERRFSRDIKEIDEKLRYDRFLPRSLREGLSQAERLRSRGYHPFGGVYLPCMIGRGKKVHRGKASGWISPEGGWIVTNLDVSCGSSRWNMGSGYSRPKIAGAPLVFECVIHPLLGGDWLHHTPSGKESGVTCAKCTPQ
jgi:hypothetical protein